MKYLILSILLVIALSSVVVAARDRENLSSGTTNYQTEDGNERHEEVAADGSLKGHYSYIDPKGKKVQVNYVAGKDGFKATGDHFAVFNLGSTDLEKDAPLGEDSQSHPSYYVHRKIPSYQAHKEISSYTPSSNEQELSSYTQTRAETPVIRHEIQRPKPRPEIRYRPEPVQHYNKQPEIQETYESLANIHGGNNDHAISYINLEKETSKDNNANDDDDDEEDEEEEQSYVPQSYSTYRPPTSKHYFTTKTPAYQPTFKPYYHEEQPSIEHNPITTKFTIKHPVEKFSISQNQHKFPSSSIEYPDLTTKTTYHSVPDSSTYDKTKFESGDDLTNFDTTKLLNDYHNNQPSVFPTTKFTIEDVSAPSHGQSIASKPSNEPVYKFEDFKSEKAPEYTFSDFKSEKTPEYTFNDFKSENIPEYTFSDFKSDKSPQYTFNDFKSDKTPEYKFSDFKTQNAPEFTLTKFNDFKPENFQQPDFTNFFKTETSSYTSGQDGFSNGKPQEEDGQLQFLNVQKNPANLGKYQQYLKSTEDEKIEQQYIQEQLKFKQQPNKQRTRPSYSRPDVNSHHPGRRPPKRPTQSLGLGTFRTTFKIPYGFHV